MADLVVSDDELRVELSGREEVGALTRSFSVPLGSVVSVERVDNVRRHVRGWRAPGTGLPGLIALGRWRRRGAVDFVSANRQEPGYVIELTGVRFERLVISSPPVPQLDAVIDEGSSDRP